MYLIVGSRGWRIGIGLCSDVGLDMPEMFTRHGSLGLLGASGAVSSIPGSVVFGDCGGGTLSTEFSFDDDPMVFLVGVGKGVGVIVVDAIASCPCVFNGSTTPAAVTALVIVDDNDILLFAPDNDFVGDLTGTLIFPRFEPPFPTVDPPPNLPPAIPRFPSLGVNTPAIAFAPLAGDDTGKAYDSPRATRFFRLVGGMC